MAVKKISKVIDGHEIEIIQFNGYRGFLLKIRLSKLLLPILSPVLAPVLANMASGVELSEKDNAQIMGKLPEALTKLSEVVEPEEFVKLVMDMFASTFVNGRNVDESMFDDFFTANYYLIYKLLYEVIDANGFLGSGIIGIVPQSQKEKKIEK